MQVFVTGVTCTAVILNVKGENGGDEKLSITDTLQSRATLKTLSLDFFIEVVALTLQFLSEILEVFRQLL